MKMRSKLAKLSCLILLSTASCTSTFDSLNSSVAADPLDLTSVQDTSGGKPYSFKIESDNAHAEADLDAVAMDSVRKCNAFMSRLVFGNDLTDTGLTEGSTIASGLATIFTPVAAIHALAGTATILTGSRSNVDTNVYKGATIDLYVKAIQNSYYPAMGSYLQYLNAAGQASTPLLNVGIEAIRIQTIHAECSKGSALASINAKLTPGSASAPSGTSTATFQVVDPNPNGQEDFTLNGAELSSASLSFDYKVTAADQSASAIAQDIVAAINKNQGFMAANISAALAPSDNTSIVVTSPTSPGIIWKSGVLNNPNASFGPPAVAATPPVAGVGAQPAAAAAGPRIAHIAQPAAASVNSVTAKPLAQPPIFVPGT